MPPDLWTLCPLALRQGGLTPYDYICKIWASKPDRFIVNPIHQMSGLNRMAKPGGASVVKGILWLGIAFAGPGLAGLAVLVV